MILIPRLSTFFLHLTFIFSRNRCFLFLGAVFFVSTALAKQNPPVKLGPAVGGHISTTSGGVGTTSISNSENKSCSRGYYSGPQPGKKRYTKDPWIWVVSRQFAADFCMPVEFVDDGLKGAEAVAFKIDENRDEEVCGWGDQQEVCNRRKFILFEIYLKSAPNFSRRDPGRYAIRSSLPSRYLISNTESELNALQKRVAQKPKSGVQSVTHPNRVALFEVGSKGLLQYVLPLTEKVYFSDVFVDIDLISFDGPVGFINRSSSSISSESNLLIGFQRPSHTSHVSEEKERADLEFMVELPTRFSNAVRNAEKKYNYRPESFAKDVLREKR